MAVHASLVLLLSPGETAAELLREFTWSCRRASTALVNWSILTFRGFSGCSEPDELWLMSSHFKDTYTGKLEKISVPRNPY